MSKLEFNANSAGLQRRLYQGLVFKTCYEAVRYATKNKLKDWCVIKVEDHYVITNKEVKE